MSVKKLKKEELKILAEELGLNVEEGARVIDLKNLIEGSDIFKTDREFVENVIFNILEQNKVTTENELANNAAILELEKIRLAQLEREIELANLRKEIPKTKENFDYDLNNRNTENLIKSIKTLTISVPSKVESFNLFFQSLEKAFRTKNVPDELKSEILLNILGEKITNLMVYVSEDDIKNYEKLKSLVLKEFQPTPQECLNQFRNAQKLPAENFVQYASRLTANFEYYCQLREVSEFKSLCELIVADKIFADLDRELKTHVAVKQGEKWLRPQDLSRECDIYLSSRGKTKSESFSTRPYSSYEKKYSNESKYRYGNNSKGFSNVYVSGVKGYKCPICKTNENHCVSACPNFKRLSINERVEVIKCNNLCFKCFHSECGGARSCKAKNCFCGLPHHPMIHFSRSRSENKNLPSKTEVVNNTQCNSSVSMSPKPSVLLLTCSVYASSPNRKLEINKLARILCDNGSERSWCTKKFAKSLQLKPIRRERLTVFSFGSPRPVEKNYEVAEINLISRYNPDQFIQIEVLISDTITAAPISIPNDNVQKIMHSRGLNLADCCGNNANIEILIGADAFWEVVDASSFEKIDHNITCVPTIFGYALQGSQESKEYNFKNVVSANFCAAASDVQMLWDLEALGIKEREELNSSDKAIIDQFEGDLKFVKGKYETNLLWKTNPSELGNNFSLAKKRFHELQIDFSKNKWVAEEYNEIISEQVTKGIIEECKRDVSEYFMPHRAVVREDKETTKVRVVFNCSSKSRGNVSLNDCLETGPNLNPNILDMILNFRKFKIAFSADIEKAFLMIGISERDRKYLKFLWYSENLSEEYKLMRMKRLPFGCKTSPFILSATIKYHIKKFKESKPKSVEMLDSALYVDDLYHGGNCVSEAYELSSDAISILKAGGFNLRKLRSNSRELERLWVESGLSESESTGDYQMKVLGLNWDPEQDMLSLDVKGLLDSRKRLRDTKRCILQTAASIFDPVGLISPFVVRIKCLLQEIWERAIDWDDELPEDLRKKWTNWCEEVGKLCEVTVPRNCLLDCESNQVELHVFCDAAPSAYGSVAYFRFCESGGKFRVLFVMSKSRVAPLKKLTLPRLELMALVIGARIGNYLRGIFKESIEKIVFWSDSLVALHWVRGGAKRWKQFVANRVLEIQEKSNPSDWRYCPSEDNPADLLTRGISSENLVSNKRWWIGPKWLSEERETWPQHCIKEVSPEIVEPERVKNIVSVSLSVSSSCWIEHLIPKYSSWSKLLRVVAWCIRFITNLKRVNVLQTQFLQTKELNAARTVILRCVQTNTFHEEIDLLSKEKTLSPRNKLIMLHPYLDNDKILRVGGRLRNSNLPEEIKHPIILPKSHYVSELIVKHFHHQYLHGGTQLLLSALRQQYWIINARAVIRKILHRCVTCCRNRTELSQQVMGDLPASRVNPARPFSKTGADLAGPFHIKPRKGRGVRTIKTYICVFVCFTTKAVHLEMVGDLTANSFIGALKRFVSRRGKPSEMHSDCGTNFVGAYKELKAWMSREVVDHLTNEGISWKFNPPSAPHFGGLWESAVKSLKYHMRRVIGSQVLTYEEFLTYVVEIEACLNSRPLVSVSNDPNDYQVLTPSHFLIGTSVKGIPEPDVSHEKLSLNDRWKRVRQISQAFWKRWSSDYVTQLQQRSKWQRPVRNIKVNDLVIVKDDHLPPFKWKLGRVTRVHEGPDKKVRVVQLKTALGEMKRPIHKLCVLPIETHSSNCS